MFSRLFFVALLTAGFAARADNCSYCGRIDRLRADMAKVKPEPLNEKTGLKQSKMVDEGIDIAEGVLKKSDKDISAQDLEQIVKLLADLTPYDAPNIIGQSIVDTGRKHLKRVLSEVRRQDAAKTITREQSKRLIDGLAMAEDVSRNGNDPNIPEDEEIMSKNPDKKKSGK